MASILKANVENFVPESLQRDLKRKLRQLKDKGASHLMIMVPLADFEPMQRDISAQCYRPYVPVLFDIPVVPWAGDHVCIKARPDRGQNAPIIFTLDGVEYDHSHVVTPPLSTELILPDNHKPFRGN